MNPSVELRLRTMMRAMTEVILPAVDPQNSLAQEQAQLMLGHLNALLQHHENEQTLSARDDAANRALAAALLDAGDGGSATGRAREAVRTALKDTDGNALTHAIERLVVAIGLDGEPDLHAACTRLVMAHARAQNLIGRAWFKPMGFDPRPDELPEPTNLFEDPEP